MRIAFFHNWSSLGAALGHSLLASADYELLFVGGHRPLAERDSSLEQAARDKNVVCATLDAGWPDVVECVRRFTPHLIVVGTFSRKIPSALLAVPEFAALNVHPSLLPRLRGGAPEYWAIRNGDTVSGVTIHHMTPRFDDGAIVAQASFALLPSDTLLSVAHKTARAATPLLEGLLQRYLHGERPGGDAQDEALATQALTPTEADLKLRWTQPADTIERHVRAAYPAFPAHTLFRGEQINIRSAQVLPSSGLRPGELHLDLAARRLVVGTGSGSLALLSVMPASGISSDGFQFAERRGLTVGEILD